MFKLKILFVGPCASGKTVLTNFLSDTTDKLGGEYRPTQGVRIVVLESQPESSPDPKPCEVELWDCSGDFKFESCWPALMSECSGVVLVFNPSVPSQLTETESWFSMFVSSQSLPEAQCLLISHHQPGSSARTHTPLGSPLSRLALVHSDLEEDPEAVRQHFSRYLKTVVNAVSESREREEMSIIT